MLARIHANPKGRISLLLGFVVFSSLPEASGAPVILRFESVIDNVVIQRSPDLISPLQIGDRVFGQFTYDPVDAPYVELGSVTAVNVPHPLVLTLNDDLVLTQDYGIESRDEDLGADTELRADAIFVSNFQWDEYAGLSQLGFRPGAFSLRFTRSPAGSNILDGPDVPSDATIWNSFPSRRFSLFLIDENDRGSVLIFGSVEVASIPEADASTFVLLALCGAIVYCVSLGRRFPTGARRL